MKTEIASFVCDHDLPEYLEGISAHRSGCLGPPGPGIQTHLEREKQFFLKSQHHPQL